MKIRKRKDWPNRQYGIAITPASKEIWISYGKNTLILDFWKRRIR